MSHGFFKHPETKILLDYISVCLVGKSMLNALYAQCFYLSL